MEAVEVRPRSTYTAEQVHKCLDDAWLECRADLWRELEQGLDARTEMEVIAQVKLLKRLRGRVNARIQIPR